MPVILEKHIQHWEQEEPQPLEEALIATTFKIPGVDDKEGVLYSMQFRNPRPDIEIKSIDVILPENQHGR